MRYDHIPRGEARELDDIDAQRALFDVFGILAELPTEPMPLKLEETEPERERSLWLRILSKG